MVIGGVIEGNTIREVSQHAIKAEGAQRIEPGPGQESVWDYPRPPRVEASKRRVRIVFNGRVTGFQYASPATPSAQSSPAFTPADEINRKRSSFCCGVSIVPRSSASRSAGPI